MPRHMRSLRGRSSTPSKRRTSARPRSRRRTRCGRTLSNSGCPSCSELTLELPSWAAQRGKRTPGYEQATLSFAPGQPGSSASAVRATTIDRFLAERRLSRVHVLVVDTNGMDALVLEGAAATLAAKRVDLLTFEYHESFFWRACAECRSLRGVLRWLDQRLGYACYWQGQHGGVARASGPRCWQEGFEFRAWSNLVCTARADLIEVLDRLPVKLKRNTDAAPARAKRNTRRAKAAART